MYILRSITITKYEKRGNDIVDLAWENNLPEKRFKSRLFALIGYYIRLNKTKKTCKYYRVILYKEHYSRVFLRETQNYDVEYFEKSKPTKSQIKTLKALDKAQRQRDKLRKKRDRLKEKLTEKEKRFKHLQKEVEKYWSDEDLD